jgi:hypothetical protein
LFGKENSSRLRHRHGRSSQMLKEQPSQLTFTHAEACGKLVYAGAVAVKAPFPDERQGSGHGIRCPSPGGEFRRGFRPATKTGTKARVLRGRRRTVKKAIHKLWSAGRTHGPAIDPGSLYSYVEEPVKTGVPTLQGSIAHFLGRQLHLLILPSEEGSNSGFRTSSSKECFAPILLQFCACESLPSLRT